MIKITFLIRALNYGGAQRQLVTLVKALNPNQFNVTVLSFYSGHPLEKELQESGIDLISLDKGGRWDVFGFFWRLVNHLKEKPPDVLHGYLGVANLLSICLKPFFPTTRMIWGVRASNIDLTRYDLLESLTFQLECFFSRFADLIVVNSKAGYTYHLIHEFPASKMVVIPNGIDTERFQPDREERIRITAEWGTCSSAILIGLVGRLDPMKDHPTFLQAAALLSRENQNIYFVCVGTGPESYAHKLYQLADELGISAKVIWTGGRADMPGVHNAFDIACSASFGEGFPNVIGEAMACGVPCVVTDVGDSAWIVGDTGIVVPPKNPEALANGWKQCLEMNRSEMGQKARSRIVENFSVKQLVDRTEKVILSAQ